MLPMFISSYMRLMSCENVLPIVAWNDPATSVFLSSQSQTSILTELAFLSSSDELKRSSSPSPVSNTKLTNTCSD